MERETSPNEALTATYIGEQLVEVPLFVFYMGELGIKKYLEENGKDTA